MDDPEAPNERVDLKEEYANFDYTRPPFRVPDEKRQATPLYPEIDERSLWLKEECIFNLNSYPTPPKNLDANHPIARAYQDLLKEYSSLDANMDEIIDCSPNKNIVKGQMGQYHSQVRELLSVYPDVKFMRTPQFMRLKEPGNSPRMKTLNRMHFTTKKLFFQAAVNYMWQYLACPEVPEELKTTQKKELTHWIEVIQVGHIVYNPIKSAVHAKEPKRKNGELTMNHLYQVCVHIINRAIETLKLCTSYEEKEKVLEDLKERVLIAEAHDYDEDYPMLGIDFLDQKLSEHFTPDTAKEILLRSSGYQRMPYPTNIYRRRSDNIIPVLRALSKPQDKNQKKGYLTRHRNDLKKESQVIQFLSVKAADRLNNLKNLGPQSIRSKHRTICETAELIQLLEETRPYHPYVQILDLDIEALRCTALTEGLTLKEHNALEMDADQTIELDTAISYFKAN